MFWTNAAGREPGGRPKGAPAPGGGGGGATLGADLARLGGRTVLRPAKGLNADVEGGLMDRIISVSLLQSL